MYYRRRGRWCWCNPCSLFLRGRGRCFIMELSGNTMICSRLYGWYLIYDCSAHSNTGYAMEVMMQYWALVASMPWNLWWVVVEVYVADICRLKGGSIVRHCRLPMMIYFCVDVCCVLALLLFILFPSKSEWKEGWFTFTQAWFSPVTD